MVFCWSYDESTFTESSKSFSIGVNDNIMMRAATDPILSFGIRPENAGLEKEEWIRSNAVTNIASKKQGTAYGSISLKVGHTISIITWVMSRKVQSGKSGVV